LRAANPLYLIQPCRLSKDSRPPHRERFYFVTREETQKVIEACPDAEWRLIVALARYGGLRCPSEHFALRWRDIDWEHDKIRVASPKTEHHPGGESRVIPLFPELRPYLEEAFEQAKPGVEYVLGPHYRNDATNVNLRSRLLDIIWRAGLKEWPKLFQNMRSSRETELADAFPAHVVCAWIGNSEPVAAKFYLQVTDEHFVRAVSPSEHSEDQPKGALQNPVQQPAAIPRKGSHEKPQVAEKPAGCGTLRPVPELCGGESISLVAEAGLEPARPVRGLGF
jgi:hypothetical protein